MDSQSQSINEIIERNPLSSLQKWVMLLCTFIIVFDGFDILVISFAAPAITSEWDMAKDDLGLIFSAALIGMMLGALIFGPLGDRFGRRKVILISVSTFALFTFLTAYANTFGQLAVLRFLTGLGLGGALPNTTALMTEYVPERLRNFSVAIIFIGIPAGGIAGGLLASWLIPAYGWPSIFVVGGVLPLLLAPLLYKFLPESPRFLMQQKNTNEKIRELARKIESKLTITDETIFVAETKEDKHRFPVSELFAQHRTVDTLLLWMAFFSNLMVIYFLYSWIPTLLVDTGHALKNATLTTVVMNVGGAIGPLILARFIVRKGSRWVMTICFLAGAVSLAAIGQVTASLLLVMLGAFFAGFFVIGGQVSLNALASFIYPTHIRATGVGWALGIGRIGSIMGPLLAGQLILLKLGMEKYFLIFGSILIITSISIFFIRKQQDAVIKH